MEINWKGFCIFLDMGEKVELKRNLGLGNCVSLLIGLIIGTGIFISPKVMKVQFFPVKFISWRKKSNDTILVFLYLLC